MKVSVQAFGSIREAANLAYGEFRTLDLAAGATVAEAASSLGIDPHAVVNALIDGRAATQRDRLHDGAELTLMPAFTGGS